MRPIFNMIFKSQTVSKSLYLYDSPIISSVPPISAINYPHFCFQRNNNISFEVSKLNNPSLVIFFLIL